MTNKEAAGYFRTELAEFWEEGNRVFGRVATENDLDDDGRRFIDSRKKAIAALELMDDVREMSREMLKLYQWTDKLLDREIGLPHEYLRGTYDAFEPYEQILRRIAELEDE